MFFRLIRLVSVRLSRQVPVSVWQYPFGEVSIHSIEHPFSNNDGTSVFLLAADMELSTAFLMDGTEILIPDQQRHDLETALDKMADLLAVTHQCSRSVRSVLPYVAIDPIDAEAQEWLKAATTIRVQKNRSPDRMKHDHCFDDAAIHLAGRLDGVSLLAESLCQEHPTGRLHEYMRIFERAFARPAGDVCRDYLVRFLSPLGWGYDQNEVQRWLQLRHMATHADRRHDYATEVDTRPVVNRMEQAAFDVLFNKEKWHDTSIARRRALKPIYGSLSSLDNSMFKTPESKITAVLEFIDGFSTYPLDLRLDLYGAVPNNWFTKTSDVRQSTG